MGDEPPSQGAQTEEQDDAIRKAVTWDPAVGERTLANNARDEPPSQGARTEEQDAAVDVQRKTIKSATPGDNVPMMKNKKSVKPTLGERTPAESPGDEPPSQGARTEEQDVAVDVQGKTIKSATPGDNVPMMKKKKSVKPTLGERTPAESPGDEPPSQGA